MVCAEKYDDRKVNNYDNKKNKSFYPLSIGMNIKEIKKLKTNDIIYYKNANNEWILVKCYVFKLIKDNITLRTIDNEKFVCNINYQTRNDNEKIWKFAEWIENKNNITNNKIHKQKDIEMNTNIPLSESNNIPLYNFGNKEPERRKQCICIYTINLYK